jgi:PGF-CTERM protein
VDGASKEQIRKRGRKMMQKAIVNAFVVIIVVFAGMMSIAIGSEISYDGMWVGNTSYGGVVRFNVSEDIIKNFTISLKEFPVDIINEVTGEKIGNATYRDHERKYSSLGIYSTITNNQFFFPSSVPRIVKNEILGVFTSKNNATGTWQYVKIWYPSSPHSGIEVSPLIAWDATKVHTTETPTLTPTLSPTPTVTSVPFTPTPMLTPSPTATATGIPTPEEKEVPGFEVIFAIMGLLAVAYLLRRRG